MKRFLFTLLLIILCQTCCNAFEHSIRFVQLTDVHFDPRHENQVELLNNTIKDINSLDGISFVVFTGDNINTANPQHLDAFMKVIKKLHVPYYIVLGNHDVFKSQNLSKEQYNEIVRSNNIFWLRRKWDYSFKKNGYTFIVLDGAKETIPGPGGYYRAHTLAWFDKELGKNSKRPVVVFQHFPIIESNDFGTGRVKTHRVYQPEKYYEIINKHNNVLAILSGHYHVNSEVMENGIYHINTPTLLAEPNCYKIIDIISKKGLSPVIYTQLREVNVQ